MRIVVALLSVVALVSGLELAPLHKAPRKIGDRHIVALKRDMNVDVFAGRILDDAALFDQRPVIVRKLRSALKAVIVDMKDDMVDLVRSMDGVEFVEEDDVVYMESEVNWGLDRIDQRNGDLDDKYSSGYGLGLGANIFIVDSGVRTTHTDFGGRAYHSANFISNENEDCNGHGTHCAGIAAGSSVGVAKLATIHAVKIFDCDGSSTFSAIASGVDHVTGKKESGMANVIASMSLSANSWSVERAVEGALGAGVVVITSSGNNQYDACNLVPGNMAGVITVGNTQKDDTIRASSNYGICVDILAPGTDIMSCSHRGDSLLVSKTGTSMACPHVAGAAAILLADRDVAPSQVLSTLVGEATNGQIKWTDEAPQYNTPNKLLFVCPNTSEC